MSFSPKGRLGRTSSSGASLGPPPATAPPTGTPGMSSGYDDSSFVQLAAFQAFWPWLKDALQSCPVLPPAGEARTLCVADYGCSSGRNSRAHFDILRQALEDLGALSGEGSTDQLVAVLNDIPGNDWAATVRAFDGAPDLVTLLAPRSFYSGPVAPLDSVHLGMSTDAVCWLSQAPHVAPPDHLTYWRQGEQLREAFWRQGEADFSAFLRYRALEFVVGGLLLVITPGTLGDRCISEGLLDCLYDAAKQRAAKGQLDAHLLRDFAWPGWMYSAEEMEQLAVASGRWEVVQLGTHVLTHVLDELRGGGDPAAYARAVVGTVRAFSESLMRKALALSAEGADALYATAEQLVTERPERYVFRNIQAAVLLRRLPERKKSFDDAAIRSKYRRSLEFRRSFA